MLAPNYKSAEDLGITEDQKLALLSVMHTLQKGECTKFDMSSWCHCIYGNAMKEHEGREDIVQPMMANTRLNSLFVPCPLSLVSSKSSRHYADITQPEAGEAVRNFLTEGTPHWERVLEDA